MFVGISCNDKTVNPIPDPEPEPCEVPKYNQYTMYSGAIRIHNISNDGKFLFYSKLENDEDYKKVTILNTLTNEKKEIMLDSLIFANFEFPFVRVLVSPYDENVVLLELFHKLSNNSELYSKYYKYLIKDNQILDVTPSIYFDNGIPINSTRDKVWLTNSSAENDYFFILNKGVFRFQTWEHIETSNNSVFQYAISNSAKYKVIQIKTDTFFTLNEFNITNSNQFKRQFQFSPDERFLMFIEDIQFDTLNPFTFVQKLHIYDVEKTISTGKASLLKTIDLPTDLCAFQFTNYVISPRNTIYISMSRFDFKPMKNIYEIDFNGKILRQLTNE